MDAVKYLKEHEGEKMNGDDSLINRKAAIKIASEECFELRGIFGRIKDRLNTLPSAQPGNKELLAWQEDFRGYIKMLNLPRDDYKGIMEYIDEVPSAQPERKPGNWYKMTGMMPPEYAGVYRCSECNEIAMRDWKHHRQELTRFCPNCGADMR